MAVVFKGFSSPVVGKTRVLYDIPLVKQDLVNHFNTRKGERVMDSEYGFIGWDLIFELDNSGVMQELEQDARRIVQMEPRVDLVDIVVESVSRGYKITILLNYVQLNTVDTLFLVFDDRSAERMNSQAF